jgi:hypothetical protein
VHQSFLKGARETIESRDIPFATDDVAVATVADLLLKKAGPKPSLFV